MLLSFATVRSRDLVVVVTVAAACAIMMAQVELKARRLLCHYQQALNDVKRGKERAHGILAVDSSASSVDKHMLYLEVRVPTSYMSRVNYWRAYAQ